MVVTARASSGPTGRLLLRSWLAGLAAIVFNAGCSSPAQVEERAPGRESPAPAILPPKNPLPFRQILEQADSLSRSELLSQLNAVVTSSETGSEDRQKSAYMLARAIHKTGGSPAEVMRLYDIAARCAPLTVLALRHKAECAAEAGQEEVVRSSLASLKASGGPPETMAFADYGLAQSYLRAGEKARARDAFTAIIEAYPGSDFALGSDYYVGQMEIETQETRKDGIKRFLRYIEKSPSGTFSLPVVETLAGMPDFKPRPQQRALLGRVWYAHQDWAKAASEWKQAGQSAPWLEHAFALMRTGRPAEARQLLLKGIKDRPDDPAVPAAAQTLCNSLGRAEASALWAQVLATSTAHGDEALWNLARRAAPAEAFSYYARLIAKYPDSAYAPEAHWWLFWDEAKRVGNAQAIKRASLAVKRYPRARAAPRFLFWSGKLHERAGQRESARQCYRRLMESYPESYYGHRAAGRLAFLAGGRDPGFSTAPASGHPARDWQCPPADAVIPWPALRETAGETACELLRLQQWDESMPYLEASPPAKAYALLKLALPLDAINTAARSLAGPPGRGGLWQIAYPLLHAGLVSAESKASSVDPLLVHALIREESRYNASAVSRSHALGLMQLLPGTARGVAARLGVKLDGEASLFRPEVNIKLGTSYLGSGISRAGGNAMLAVAGYNGGPNAVKAWQRNFKQKGLSDLDVFVEDIPYKETREYVRKVFASYWNYRAVYRREPR